MGTTAAVHNTCADPIYHLLHCMVEVPSPTRYRRCLLLCLGVFEWMRLVLRCPRAMKNPLLPLHSCGKGAGKENSNVNQTTYERQHVDHVQRIFLPACAQLTHIHSLRRCSPLLVELTVDKGLPLSPTSYTGNRRHFPRKGGPVL